MDVGDGSTCLGGTEAGVGISMGVIGRCGVYAVVVKLPVTAHVMMTLSRGLRMSFSLGRENGIDLKGAVAIHLHDMAGRIAEQRSLAAATRSRL
jgi:hypothetical protein